MRVIVGCEMSGTVREAFLSQGHEAYSCDTEPGLEPSPFHIQDDVFAVLARMQFDLGIFHPPCTYLTLTGNKWFKPEYADRFPTRHEDRKAAIEFFKKIAQADIPKICIENPIGVVGKFWKTQIISPHQFGHKEPKRTMLWLKNLPALQPTKMVEPEYYTTKSGKRMPLWYAYADKSKGEKHRKMIRSKTFQGIADAMADQWGNAEPHALFDIH
jgi:hypothetical protein